ncbi:gag-pol polyprotein [Cucumis melo var. makuwa]|uniref:Gag-pol polyprotein n=1 Tax=Cucumis melo var. makuwa TaxID=1194695 RepID=A0A5A7V837_CUCMM|nr:gag-pol polyprotein [Cucumis melo var. makuwa]
MEIIREGPSTSRPPVLDGKNYSYWKPRMIFFIKTLDGKAWRALVQASVGNARALNMIFNGVDLNVFKLINSCSTAKETWKTLEVAYEGTSKVKISRLQLITSKFESLRMTEDESVSDYNKRVLEITNEPLLLGEKIPDSKIVRKVLQSLPRKFDMKVTVIEEAHDITMLKLDEFFGLLLTFEMATANRESKKGKGIAFKSTHVSGEAVSDTEANMDENDDGTTRRNNENSDRRSDGYIKKKEGRDDDGNIKAFTIQIIDEDTDDESGCYEESKNDKLSIEKLETLWKEDCEARAIQKERIQDLIEENERLMFEWRINSRHNGFHRYGLGFVASASSLKATSEIKFVSALKVVEHGTTHTEIGISTTVKSLRRTCYYCGRKGHIRSICYKLRRDQLHQQKYWNRSHAQPHMVWRIKSAE